MVAILFVLISNGFGQNDRHFVQNRTALENQTEGYYWIQNRFIIPASTVYSGDKNTWLVQILYGENSARRQKVWFWNGKYKIAFKIVATILKGTTVTIWIPD